MVAATFRSFVGIGKETTPGTGVVPTHYIPITADPVSKDTIKYLPDMGWRGSMVKVYGETSGPKQGEIAVKGNVDLKPIGFALASVLGDYATTGAGAPFTHTFSVLNSTDGQGKSYSFTDFNGFEARQFAGGKCENLTFKFNADGLFVFESKWATKASTVVSAPTSSYGTYTPIANFRGNATIGGSASLLIEDGEIVIKRKVDYMRTLNNGAADAYKEFAGPVEVSGKLTFVLEDTAQLLNYLNNSQPALNIKWDTGTGVDFLQLVVTKAAYDTGVVKRSKDYAEVDVSFVGVANSTDAGASGGLSVCKATLSNTEPANTYA